MSPPPFFFFVFIEARVVLLRADKSAVEADFQCREKHGSLTSLSARKDLETTTSKEKNVNVI